MKAYIVWNERRTEGYVSFSKAVAYEARKGADSNCFDEDGNRMVLAQAFTEVTVDDACTIEEIELLNEVVPDGPLPIEALRALPDMSQVMIEWHGWNGAHAYVVKWHGDGLWAFDPDDLKWPVDLVMRSDDLKPLHEVWLATPTSRKESPNGR